MLEEEEEEAVELACERGEAGARSLACRRQGIEA